MQRMLVVLMLSQGLSTHCGQLISESGGHTNKIQPGTPARGGLSQRIRLISDDTMLGLNWGIK